MIFMSKGSLRHAAALVVTSATGFYVFVTLLVFGTVLLAKLMVAILATSASLLRAKRVFAAEMRKAGIPEDLAKRIAASYTPTLEELLLLVKTVAKSTEFLRI